MPRFEVRFVGTEYVLGTPQGLFEIDEDSVQDLYDTIDECDRVGEGSAGVWFIHQTNDEYYLSRINLFDAHLTSDEMNELVHSIEALGFE